MIEFIRNIGQWFVENKNGIIIALSSVDFAALGTLIYHVVKQRLENKEGVTETKKLSKLLAENETLNEEVKTLKAENKELKKDVHTIKDQNELILNKMNAVLEVQSIVYSTIKDETTRVTVGNIINTAKHDEFQVRAKLYEELETLKRRVAEQSKVLEDTVNKTISDVETTVKPNTIITRQ